MKYYWEYCNMLLAVVMYRCTGETETQTEYGNIWYYLSYYQYEGN